MRALSGGVRHRSTSGSANARAGFSTVSFLISSSEGFTYPFISPPSRGAAGDDPASPCAPPAQAGIASKPARAKQIAPPVRHDSSPSPPPEASEGRWRDGRSIEPGITGSFPIGSSTDMRL